MMVTVRDVIGRATVLAGGSGLDREVTSPQVAAPDLSSTVSWKDLAAAVVHVAPAQSAWLRSLPASERVRVVGMLFKQKPACIVVTGSTVSKEFLGTAGSARIPVVKTGNLSGVAKLLIQKLTPKISVHGVLVEVFGLGTLIMGESAIGKSEAALDLVLRGHKLAADDLVILRRSDGRITGRATELGADLLEIRGLGIINVRALYGESAVTPECTVGLVVELEEWTKGHHYSLLGLRERRRRLLGINLPSLKLPVKPGRNMATLIEVAARNQILKNKGVYTARELNRTLKRRMAP
jgi:HPr kinase/phosphorylase